MNKGSYTIEASILIPLLLSVFALAMKVGISLRQEIYEAHEEESNVILWETQEFYRRQWAEGLFYE